MDELNVDVLSRRYGPMVLRRCRHLLRNEDEALDACQDVFVRLIEQRRRLHAQYQPGHVSTKRSHSASSASSDLPYTAMN